MFSKLTLFAVASLAALVAAIPSPIGPEQGSPGSGPSSPSGSGGPSGSGSPSGPGGPGLLLGDPSVPSVPSGPTCPTGSAVQCCMSIFPFCILVHV